MSSRADEQAEFLDKNSETTGLVIWDDRIFAFCDGELVDVQPMPIPPPTHSGKICLQFHNDISKTGPHRSGTPLPFHTIRVEGNRLIGFTITDVVVHGKGCIRELIGFQVDGLWTDINGDTWEQFSVIEGDK